MQVSLCVGNYAARPYHIAGLDHAIFCMEELVYAIHEYAFLLDERLLDERLADWIEQECGLEELSGEVRSMLTRGASLGQFVRLLMESVMLYDMEEMTKVVSVLEETSGLTAFQKRKMRIDRLVEKKQYTQAVCRYDELLRELEKEGGVPGEKIACVLYNRGVALVGLMAYVEASKSFLEAYRKKEDPDYLDAYLATKRIHMGEKEYIAFLAQTPQYYDASLQLEKRMEQLLQLYEQQESYRRILSHNSLRARYKQLYYEDGQILLQDLKKEYRNSMQEWE